MSDEEFFELIEACDERRLPMPYAPQPGDLKPYLVFGFDLCPASCGWCVLDLANHRLVAMNSFLFDAPQDGQTKESLAAQRRKHRGERRKTKRTAARKRRALEILKEADIMPRDADASWLQTRKGEAHPLFKFSSRSPIRVRALDELVSDRELAQALYSICSHRGYIPHGEGKEGKEIGDVRAALAANDEALAAGGWRTVGEMMASRGRSRNKDGDYEMCVRNADLVDECKMLIGAQRALGNAKATPKLERRLVDEVLTYLTDSSQQEAKIYDRVKKCSYFPDEPAAPRCAPSSEMCAAWEKLTALRLVHPSGRQCRLPRDVVELSMATLFSPSPIKGNKDCKVTYKRLRKMLDQAGSELASFEWTFKGVSPADEADEVCKPAGWRLLKDVLGADSMGELAGDIELADAIACAACYSYSRRTLEALLSCDPDAPDVVGCAALSRASGTLAGEAENLPFNSKAFSGYGQRSLRALDMIRTEFEQGAAGLHEALEATGLHAKQNDHPDLQDLLPAYETFDPTCTNPTVLRAMRCFRQCLNALIRAYGRPAEVHIELSRDLKVSKTNRDIDSKKNAARRKKRAEARAIIAEKRGVREDEVSGKEVLKRLLWEEFGGIDPYSGEEIVEERFVLDPDYAEIDHILPYSRTFDDSQSNKVLVLAKSNQDKGDRSPFEALDEAHFAALCTRALTAAKAKKIDKKKLEKLTCTDLAEREQEFVSRNLNDTRYMTRQAKEWVRTSLRLDDSLLPGDERKGAAKQRVGCPAGSVTDLLRHGWGFDGKDRGDDRHHALDAALIAAATQGNVMRAAKANSEKKKKPKEERAAIVAASAPWPEFRSQVLEAFERAVPCHAPNRKVGGAVLQGFSYRLLSEEAGLATYRRIDDKKKEHIEKSTNYAKTPDGKGIQRVGDHAFLQLWWDPEGKARGKKTPGRLYADPVFVHDLPALKAGTYIPKIAKKKVPRQLWEPVPESALKGGPLRIHHGDLLLVGDKLRRYVSFDISGAAWKLLGPVQGLPGESKAQERAKLQGTKGLAFSQFDKDEIKVVDSSPLGWPGYTR